jgi:hypothetical protein
VYWGRYGDDRNPYTETVDFLEDLVQEFISEMTHKSMEIGRPGRVQVKAFVVVRLYLPTRPVLASNLGSH